MKVYNTLSGKKEDLETIKDKELRMYACGITPYDDAHLGHAMQAVIFDTIRRYFEYKGYKVTYVRNYTDVDDKIIDRAKQQGIEALELSKKFVERSKRDLEKLKVRPATVEPLVSEHIGDIIAFVSELIDKGYAYEANGSVYFDVLKFKDYGKLSHRTIEDLKPEGDFTDDKHNPNDFALWKRAKDGEIFWDSPWGKGRPGWHIECSTLSQKYLGETIDIHGGGRDLVFPHHENEIAQSEARSGKTFAKYWLHNGLVTINKQKMSKSLGNFYTIRELLEKYPSDVIRFLIFSFSYGANLNFNDRDLLVVDKKLYSYYATLKRAKTLNLLGDKELKKLKEATSSFLEKFLNYMDDNFSTPRVIAEIHKLFSVFQPIVLKNYSASSNNTEAFDILQEALSPIKSVLGILDEEPEAYIDSMHTKILKRLGVEYEEVKSLLESRATARNNRDFELSDKYRNQLLEMGIEVLDNPDGTYSWFQKL